MKPDPRQTTFWTLPAFRHDAQTFIRFVPPLTDAFKETRFGSQRRFVFRWEWLME